LLLTFFFACGTAAILLIDYEWRSRPFGAQVTISTGCNHHPERDCIMIRSGDGFPDGPVMCEDADTGRRWIARIEANRAPNCGAETAGGL
jgi:hypothetical protein